MAANTPYPMVFALSNPTANSEAVPADIYRWTEGKALVATGSPFDDVMWDGAAHPVGQGNNAFIFPGLGLGVLASRAKRVTDGMLTAASLALSEFVDKGRLAQGGLYAELAKPLAQQTMKMVHLPVRPEGETELYELWRASLST